MELPLAQMKKTVQTKFGYREKKISFDHLSSRCLFRHQNGDFFLNKFIYLFLAALGLRCCKQVSLFAVSGGYSSMLCAGFSLWWFLFVAEHRLQAHRLQQLWHEGSVVVAHRLSCSVACGIFPDQGSNPCPLHWQVDS